MSQFTFDNCLQFVLKWEGSKFTNDPDDAGGATRYGVTQKVYNAYRSAHGQASRSVQFITEPEVHNIYKANYWQVVHGDSIPSPLNLVLFDTAVLMGPTRSRKFLQMALGVTVDGSIGPQTLGALRIANPLSIATKVANLRERRLRQIVAAKPSQVKYLKGWLNRLNDLRRTSGVPLPEVVAGDDPHEVLAPSGDIELMARAEVEESGWPDEMDSLLPNSREGDARNGTMQDGRAEDGGVEDDNADEASPAWAQSSSTETRATVTPTMVASLGLESAASDILEARGIDLVAIQAKPHGVSPAGSAETVPAGWAVPLRDVLDAGRPLLPPAPRDIQYTPKSIIGQDTRRRISPTSIFPYSAIASLEIIAKDGSQWVGTGWFVNAQTVITAGHCVFIHSPANPDTHGWVKSIIVRPGRDGTGPPAHSEPLGAIEATEFRSVGGWVKSGKQEFDYGAILLPKDNPIGARVGRFFEVENRNDASLRGLPLNLAGYPADKVGAESHTLWYDVKSAVNVTPDKVFYDIDTFGGQSGAPVYHAFGEKRVAVAIHAYGVSNTAASNSGTRINATVLERIQNWANR